jgi:hypothetical protein
MHAKFAKQASARGIKHSDRLQALSLAGVSLKLGGTEMGHDKLLGHHDFHRIGRSTGVLSAGLWRVDYRAPTPGIDFAMTELPLGR